MVVRIISKQLTILTREWGRSKTSGVMYGRDVGAAQAPILRCLVPADGLAYEDSVGVDSRLGEVCAVVDKVFAVAL